MSDYGLRKDFEDKIEKNDPENVVLPEENEKEELYQTEELNSEILKAEEQKQEELETTAPIPKVVFRNNKKSLGKMVKRFRKRMLASLSQ